MFGQADKLLDVHLYTNKCPSKDVLMNKYYTADAFYCLLKYQIRFRFYLVNSAITKELWMSHDVKRKPNTDLTLKKSPSH